MTDKHEKRRDALGLFYESVLKPDHQLRECAHNQKCFNELMEWRDEIVCYNPPIHRHERPCLALEWFLKGRHMPGLDML